MHAIAPRAACLGPWRPPWTCAPSARTGRSNGCPAAPAPWLVRDLHVERAAPGRPQRGGEVHGKADTVERELRLGEVDPVLVRDLGPRYPQIDVVDRCAAEPARRFAGRLRQVGAPADQFGHRDRGDQRLVLFDAAIGEGRPPALRLHFDQFGAVGDGPHAGQERPGQHADPALRRIEEGRVVAKGLVLYPQRAVDHVLEVRLEHQPGHPVRGQLVQRHLPELLIERHHEVLGDALAHVV